MVKRIDLDFPGLVRSSKNSRRIIRVRGKPRSVLSKTAQSDKDSLEQLMALAWNRYRRDRDTVFGSNDVAVRITVDKLGKCTAIEVEDRGPARLSKGRRRDLHACIETIMDAMEGIAFDDDRQVVGVEVNYVDPDSGSGRDTQ